MALAGDPPVTVVIPTHVARIENGMLRRAVRSVTQQSHRPWSTVIVHDYHGAGSAAVRNEGIERVTTEWVAFLDSDDVLQPFHLAKLLKQQRKNGADLVYPWFQVLGGCDPWPGWYGRPFDAEALLRREFCIPVTVLVRTELVRAVGGFEPDLTIAPPAQCDDLTLWRKLLAAGAKFEHLPAKTWVWHRHGGNTSGSPLLGDAKERS